MQIRSLENTNVVGTFKIVLLIGILLILFISLFSIDAQDEPQFAAPNADGSDKLAYVSNEGYLMLYDPRERTETMLLDHVQTFVLARDGRVAFTRPDETDNDLYVFDPSTPALPPINISPNTATSDYPIVWSPDGHYLAFGSYSYLDGNRRIYVWDGDNATDITPEKVMIAAEHYQVSWSDDGRLAITVSFGYLDGDPEPEIYLWDGDTTINLSQNPGGWDGNASWSRNGKVVFRSIRDEEIGTFVWDGRSFVDGSPDTDTFVHVAPELRPYYLTWTHNDLLGFTTRTDSPTGFKKQIVLWDVEREAIVEHFPISSDNAWNWLAEGGQVILSSHLASGTPSYYLDVENTAGEILFSAHTGEIAWSSDGYLAYCVRPENKGWVLSLWNGEETWTVTSVSYKPMRWQNGQHTFSCNNG